MSYPFLVDHFECPRQNDNLTFLPLFEWSIIKMEQFHMICVKSYCFFTKIQTDDLAFYHSLCFCYNSILDHAIHIDYKFRCSVANGKMLSLGVEFDKGEGFFVWVLVHDYRLSIFLFEVCIQKLHLSIDVTYC